jgi:sec-independent protein translocase protein TatB
MFDIGFSEMMVIAVVALLVLGPERLPRVARTIGHLLGRAQRYVNDVKSDINREMELSELKKVREEFETTARSVQDSVQTSARELEADWSRTTEPVSSPAAEPAEPPVAMLTGADAEASLLPQAEPTIHAPAAAPYRAVLSSTPVSAPPPSRPETGDQLLARLRAGDASAIAPDRG